ncbi:protein CHROMOSOME TRANSMISSION FIDELITY 7-like isoform X2 [Tasmannia lanceolata]|uniref:protein CHROMOSOME TRANSMISSION FIDELITY 7-like isoform X2 n=1 Tax=Tasmannia lanceolata TaxID=3420 RepID=UPI00406312D0
MQAKISAFFKPSASKNPNPPRLSDCLEEGNVLSELKEQEFLVTYKRRVPKTNSNSDDEDKCEVQDEQAREATVSKSNGLLENHLVNSSSQSRILNKKRSYAQYHLALGQSDFLLHRCSVCGLKYACGDENDEKVHKAFHKNYYQGIQFKGWRNERVVSVPRSDGDRIILVLDGDPPSHRNKVEQALKIMERELGLSDGWLHKLCKVYLFISSHRIVGCLVVEPIRTAHRVVASPMSCTISDSTDAKITKSIPTISDGTNAKAAKSNSTLQFGLVNFKREVIRKVPSVHGLEKDANGAVLCAKEAVKAICGIRAIWVVPSNRRNRIATQLLDAARKSFCKGYVLEPSQCAFSGPTSAGKALASSYCGTESFLVYQTSMLSH